MRPCLLNGSYQCVPDRDMDCITDSQVMDYSFRSLLSTGILPMLIIIPLHCYLLWVGVHTVTLTIDRGREGLETDVAPIIIRVSVT